MLDLSQQQPVVVLVHGAQPSELEQLQNALSHVSIQWHVITPRTFNSLGQFFAIRLHLGQSRWQQ